jgi:microcystin-dependent protein
MTSLPTGSVIAFCGKPDRLAAMADLGWLKCDGRMVARGSYPELFTVIGHSHGGGNDSFALPDMRGMFLRGVDDGRGKDPDAASRMQQGTQNRVGGVVGSWQDEDIVSHHHYWNHFMDVTSHGDDLAVHQSDDSGEPQNNSDTATNQDGGGSETRPINVYVYFLINSGVRKFCAITQLQDGTLLAMRTDLRVCTRRDLTASWVDSDPNLYWHALTQTHEGLFIGVSRENSLYRSMSLSDGWRVFTAGIFNSITQMADGRTLAVQTDNKLYTAADPAGTWTAHPAPLPVRWATQLLDGRLLVVGKDDNKLYVRDTLESQSTTAVANANAGDVIAVQQLKSSLILGVKTDGLLYQRGALEADWFRAP